MTSHSLHYQNVTDHGLADLEEKAENTLWRLRDKLGGSLYLSFTTAAAAPEAGMSRMGPRLSQSLPGLNGSLLPPPNGREETRDAPLATRQYFKSKKLAGSSYLWPGLVSILAISATLLVTLSILHWNYVENYQRKTSKKLTILNHWGKHKPVQADLDKLYVGEFVNEENRALPGDSATELSKSFGGQEDADSGAEQQTQDLRDI